MQDLARVQDMVASMHVLQAPLRAEKVDTKRRTESLSILAQFFTKPGPLSDKVVETCLLVLSVNLASQGLHENDLCHLMETYSGIQSHFREAFSHFWQDSRNTKMTISSISVTIGLINKSQNKQLVWQSCCLMQAIVDKLSKPDLQQYFPKVCSTLFKVITQLDLYQKKTIRVALDMLTHSVVSLYAGQQPLPKQNNLFHKTDQQQPDMFHQKLNEFLIVLKKKTQRTDCRQKMGELKDSLGQCFIRIMKGLGDYLPWELQVNMVEQCISSQVQVEHILQEWGDRNRKQIHIQEAMVQRLMNRLTDGECLVEWQAYIQVLSRLGLDYMPTQLQERVVECILRGCRPKDQNRVKMVVQTYSNAQQLALETILIYDLSKDRMTMLLSFLNTLNTLYPHNGLSDQAWQEVQDIMHRGEQHHLDSQDQNKLIGALYVLYLLGGDTQTWMEVAVQVHRQDMAPEQCLLVVLIVDTLLAQQSVTTQDILLAMELGTEYPWLKDMLWTHIDIKQIVQTHRQAIQHTIRNELETIQRVQLKDKVLLHLRNYLSLESQSLEPMVEYLSCLMHLLTRLYEKYFVRGTLRFIELVQECVLVVGQYLLKNKECLVRLANKESWQERHHLGNQMRVLVLVGKQHLLSSHPQVLRGATQVMHVTIELMHGLPLSKIQEQANFCTGDRDNVVITNGLPVLLQECLPCLVHMLTHDGLSQNLAIPLLTKIWQLEPCYMTTHFQDYLGSPLQLLFCRLDVDMYTQQSLANLMALLCLTEQVATTSQDNPTLKERVDQLGNALQSHLSSLDRQSVYRPPLLSEPVFLSLREKVVCLTSG